MRIYFDTFGFEDDPPLLLICGLGSQVLYWREEFCYGLVDRGFFVVRVDNRDGGLSTHLPDDAVYTLSDMAQDIVAVIAALGVDRVHLAGQSLGAMVAQTVAIEHPTRVQTVTSISANTGNLEFGQPSDEALAALVAPPGATAKSRSNAMWRHDGCGPVRPGSTRRRRAPTTPSPTTGRVRRPVHCASSTPCSRAGAAKRRCVRSTIPTLVVHGTLDPLIAPDGGARTAELVPGAELLMIEGMGHDLPVEAWQQIISAITAMAARSA